MADKTVARLADDARLKRELVELERAELDLADTRETNEIRRGQRVQKVLLSAKQQEQFKAHRQKLEQMANACRHRQGGEAGNPYRGKGPTALKVEKMPDGFTVCIHCLVCPLQLFSPHPQDMSKKRRKDETEEARDTRVAKYYAEKEVFDKLYESSQEDALSAEAAQPMEPGMNFTVRDLEGNIIQKRRPSDDYATSMRNVIMFG